jgi:hypothetical protein
MIVIRELKILVYRWIDSQRLLTNFVSETFHCGNALCACPGPSASERSDSADVTAITIIYACVPCMLYFSVPRAPMHPKQTHMIFITCLLTVTAL